MRFATRDLLCFTCVAAAYAAMAANGMFGGVEDVRGVVVTGTLCLVAAFACGRLIVGSPPSEAGKQLHRLAVRPGWFLHFLIIAMALGVHLQTRGGPGSGAIPFVIAQMYVLNYSTSASLHTNGLAYGRKLYRFRAHTFTLHPVGRATTLVIDGSCSPWWRLVAGDIVVPNDRVDEVAALLSPNERPAPDNRA